MALGFGPRLTHVSSQPRLSDPALLRPRAATRSRFGTAARTFPVGDRASHVRRLQGACALQVSCPDAPAPTCQSNVYPDHGPFSFSTRSGISEKIWIPEKSETQFAPPESGIYMGNSLFSYIPVWSWDPFFNAGGPRAPRESRSHETIDGVIHEGCGDFNRRTGFLETPPRLKIAIHDQTGI
jgi:hypothetical protein